MNLTRIAAALRALADAIEDDDDAPASSEAPPAPERKRKRARAYPAPLHPVSDTDMIRARRILRRRGMTP